MNELYEKVDMNKLYFEYKSSTKDVHFNKYVDFIELFNGLKNQRIKFDEHYITKRVAEKNK